MAGVAGLEGELMEDYEADDNEEEELFFAKISSLEMQLAYARKAIWELITPCEECAQVHPGSLRGIGKMEVHRNWHSSVKNDMAMRALKGN